MSAITALAPEDHWPLTGRGQRLVPDPDSGEPTVYKRVSTFAKTLDTAGGLPYWMAWRALVAAQDPNASGLVNRIQHAAKTPRGLVSELLDNYGDGRSAAQKGTDRHLLVAAALQGTDLSGLPTEAVAEITAIIRLIHSLGTLRGTEVPTVNDAWRLAGTMDYLITSPDGQPIIADLKTGNTIHRLQWALQLVAHAAARLWHPDDQGGHRGDWVAPTKPRLVVVWAPQDGRPPTLVEFDPATARAAAETAIRVEQLRKDI